MADSSCDLPLNYIKNNEIHCVGLVCNLENKDFIDDFGETLKYSDFYNKLRLGEMPTTSQVNTYRFIEAFKSFVEMNKSIVYIGFSSALSGTYQNALMARNEVLKLYPHADITVIDSRSASLGLGAIVFYSSKLLKEGATKKELVDWIENNKLKVNHWFTVSDLNHLKRGGRISATNALLGSILDIKPILNVNDKGELIFVEKVRSRKKSIKCLFDKFERYAVNPEKQTVFISHGDCIEDVLLLKSMIENKYKIKDFIINPIGPVIGSHSGPDTLALFFLSNNRNT